MVSGVPRGSIMGQMRPGWGGTIPPPPFPASSLLRRSRIATQPPRWPSLPYSTPLLTSLYTPIWLRGPLCPFCAFLSYAGINTRVSSAFAYLRTGSCTYSPVAYSRVGYGRAVEHGAPCARAKCGGIEGSRLSYLGLEAPFSLAFHGWATPLAAPLPLSLPNLVSRFDVLGAKQSFRNRLRDTALPFLLPPRALVLAFLASRSNHVAFVDARRWQRFREPRSNWSMPLFWVSEQFDRSHGLDNEQEHGFLRRFRCPVSNVTARHRYFLQQRCNVVWQFFAGVFAAIVASRSVAPLIRLSLGTQPEIRTTPTV